MSLSKGESLEGKCSDWKAWLDRMPGSEPTLRVTGKCVFPTAGYSVKLEPVEIGTNPPGMLQLNRIVDFDSPESPVPQVVTEVEVRYSEDTNAAYTEVNILPDELKISVEQLEQPN
jgi:hypothetical protein